MTLRLYAERCAERRAQLEVALARVIAVNESEREVREAFVFGSFALAKVGPTSDLDVLVIRETSLGIVDRIADLKLAAQMGVAYRSDRRHAGRIPFYVSEQ